MNYYHFHIGDYLVDTAHLSILEDGAYRRLMDRYYTTEEPLSKDEAALFRVVRARSEEEKEAVRVVLAEFFTLSDDGWKHKRCDSEIAAYQAKAEVNRANGAKGGRPKGEEIKPNGNPQETQTEPNGNPQETLTNNQEPRTKKKIPPLPPTGGKSRPQGFKAWGTEELTASVRESNHDNLLLESEVAEFIAYWTEPNSRGKPRFSLEKTWDTRRRMHTAVQVVYEKRRANMAGKKVEDGGQHLANLEAERTKKYLNELYAD